MATYCKCGLHHEEDDDRPCADCREISPYWKRLGKHAGHKRAGRVVSNGDRLMCNECCNGDRCDDPSHFARESCPFCLGTGVGIAAKIAETDEQSVAAKAP